MTSSLLVDIGNSRLKWAVRIRDRIEVGIPLVRVDGNLDFDEVWKHLDPPARVLVSNVLGDDVGQLLQQWVQAHWSVTVEFIHSRGTGYGVENGYLEPEQLGVDRWICMVAARAVFKEPVCIVDCGTAITVDVLDGMGRHQGGVICPGVKLMQDALIQGTRKLSCEGVAPGALLGRDTGTGIYSGTLTAAAGMIEKCLAEAEQVTQTRLKLLITGGGADAVVKRLIVSNTHVPDLVLKGLAVIESGGNGGVLKGDSD